MITMIFYRMYFFNKKKLNWITKKWKKKFVLLFIFYNYSHKNNNIGQHLKYKKITYEEMEDQIEFFNFDLLKTNT